MDFLIAIVGFCLTLVMIYFGRTLALRIGLADKPGGRKKHEQVTPLIGGIVIVSIFILSLFVAGYAAQYWVVIVAALTILLVGFLDDLKPINAWFKFAIQVWVSAFVVVFGQVDVELLGNALGFGDIILVVGSMPFTVLALVMFMNALNLIDGLDGLSGGLSAGVLITLMAAAFMAGGSANLGVYAMLLFPIIGFLLFNMRYPTHKKASVFMGDAGTLAIGLILAVLVIDASQGSMTSPSNMMAQAIISPAIVPWILGIAVMDALAVYLARAMSGVHPFIPDRKHIHYRLVDSGVEVGRASHMLVFFTILSANAALFLWIWGVPEFVLFWAWVCAFFIHMVLVFRPQRYNSLLKCFA